MTFPWDQWQPHLLQWSEEGWSAGEIAIGLSRLAGLRVSRNAVIGRVHRTGLWGGGAKPNPERQARKAEREQQRKAPDPGAGRAVRKRPCPRVAMAAVKPAVKVAPALRPRSPCSLMQLTDRTCRWPEGTVGDPGFFFCGAETEASVWEGCAYCPEHLARAHQR